MTPHPLPARNARAKHSRQSKALTIAVTALGVLSWLSAPAHAQAQQPKFRTSATPPILDQTVPRSGAGYTGTEGLTNIPPGAFQEDRVGIRQASLFRDTGFPNSSFSPEPVGPRVRSENAEASFRLTLPTLNAGVPFLQRGFEPQDADLKLGPVYLKLRALQAAILHSDNVNLTAKDPESGTIAYVGLTLDVLAQLTEGLRVASSVTLVYLPLDGKVGIAGYGLNDLYSFGFAAGPLAHAQVSWDTDIGGWHLTLMDDFQAGTAIYSNDLRGNDVLFDNSLFDQDLQTRTGRYSLGPASGGRRRSDNQFNEFDNRDDTVVFSNTVSAEVERLDPGSILMRARVYHQDLWYNQGNRGLPSLREGATISLISQRENMRFKPYFIYDVYRTDQSEDLQHVFRAGFTGPITDQMFLAAEVGYFTGGNGDNGMLWNVSLNHEVGPYTRQSLTYARDFNYFRDVINEGVGYNLQQILGPKLRAQFYVYRLRVEEFFDDTSTVDNEWLSGVQLTYEIGPKTTLRLTGEYAKTDLDGREDWLGRADLAYNFTDTLLLQLSYQYRDTTIDIFDQRYTENLIFLSLTKYFR